MCTHGQPGRPPTGLRHSVLLTLVSTLVACLVSACGNQGGKAESRVLEQVTVAATDLAGSSAIIVADAKGFFREEGLDAKVVLHPSGQVALSEVVAGRADFATVGDTPLARAILAGKSLKIIASLGENSAANFIIGRRDREISGPSDLPGKRIGRVPWSTADFFLHAYLTTSGIDLRDVLLHEYGPTQLVPALMSGEVDAISTWPPYATLVTEQLGTNAVLLHDPLIYAMIWNVVVKADWATVQPSAIRKFLRAIIRASQLIRNDPESSCAIYAGRMGLQPAAAASAWKGWGFHVTLDQSLILDLEDQARWILRREATSQAPPNFLEFVYYDGLRVVEPALVSIPGK